ncbi:MAG: squalene/phytoene synthase family protein [Pseudomonadota bacterium]
MSVSVDGVRAGLAQHLLPELRAGDAWADEPGAFAARVLAEAKSSFAFGLKTLPRRRREAMVAIYAFARTIDDIADSDAPRADKLAALEAWRTEISRVYRNGAKSPVGRALERSVPRFELPQREFELMIDGMAMDVEAPIISPCLKDLAAYTRRVAGTVGQLSVRCFGAPPSEARDAFALCLADALQLTNILRDVDEDAARGRIYLPAELLEKHSVPADCATIADHPRRAEVCASLGAIARAQFAAARAALGALHHGTVRPALIFMGVYEGYLDRIEAAGWNGAAMKPMGRLDKILRGLRYAFFLPDRPAGPALSSDCPFPERVEMRNERA